MNEEIKEILDNIKKCCNITKDQSFTVYQRQDILKLLDYITNLQQENEHLQKQNKGLHDLIIQHIDEEDNLIDYKSRCEKAIEMLKAMKHCDNWIGRKRTNIITLLNILQNGSDEDK